MTILLYAWQAYKRLVNIDHFQLWLGLFFLYTLEKKEDKKGEDVEEKDPWWKPKENLSRGTHLTLSYFYFCGMASNISLIKVMA